MSARHQFECKPAVYGFWTDERVGELDRLWNVEGLSASQIAEAMGAVSRSAVIGVIHRKKLNRRAPPQKPTGAVKERHVRLTSAVRIASVPLPAGIIRHDEPGLVADLEHLHLHMCKWPIGDVGPGLTFCGKPAADGRPYCAGHAARAHERAPGLRKPPTANELMRSLRRFA